MGIKNTANTTSHEQTGIQGPISTPWRAKQSLGAVLISTSLPGLLDPASKLHTRLPLWCSSYLFTQSRHQPVLYVCRVPAHAFLGQTLLLLPKMCFEPRVALSEYSWYRFFTET